jgi:hypothetical protein
MASKDFEDFRWSCFDPSFHAVRNGLDVAALLRLTGDERAEAERLVLDALPSTIDSRPIQAAGYLRLQAAREILKQRLATNFDGERVYNRVNTAEALHRIEAWPGATAVVVEALRDRVRGGEWTALVVVDALREIGPSPEAFAAVMARLLVEGDTFAASQLTDLLEHLAGAEGGDEALVAIPERERTELEQTILRQLERTRDSRLVVPLGLLRSAAAAAPVTALLHGWRGKDRVRAAVALYRIVDYRQTEDVILKVLHGPRDEHQMSRREAAFALARLRPTRHIVDALFYTISADEDRFVAWSALLALRQIFRHDHAASALLGDLDQPLTGVFAAPTGEVLRRLQTLSDRY